MANIKKFEICDFSLSIDLCDGAISEISRGEESVDFSSLAWAVELSDGTRVTKKDGFEFSCESSDALTLTWDGKYMSVTLTLFSEGGMLKSKIKVDSRAKSINRVYYPLYEDVRAKAGDSLVIPWQNGLAVKDPIKNLITPDKDVRFWMGRGGGKYENEYPAQFSYQFFAYYAECGKGYYMSCEDGDAYIKTMGAYASDADGRLDFRFVNYPENMGIVKSYETPYVYAFTFINDGWREAAMIYRGWAKKQKWYVPLRERDISNQLSEIDFVRINHEHYRVGTDDAEFLETSKMIKERLGCKPLLHWYGWNKAPGHGAWYPEMADWSDDDWYKGLIRRNAELDAVGVKKIPYVNVHLWNNDHESFDNEHAIDYLVMTEAREIVHEPWMPVGSRFPVCHSTEKIKNKSKVLFHRLVETDGFDGIYIDQVGSFYATLCFNEKHGHPIGGGRWWADEYHKMIGSFREEMPKGKILTTESCCEVYHDLFDMFLILDTSIKNSGFPKVCGADNTESLPLFKMIYGDSAIAYGSACAFETGDGQFEFNYMRNILFGMIPTVEGVEAIHADDTVKWDILKRGVDFFKENREVLIYGELLDYKTYNGAGIKVEFNGLVKTCPEVISAVYTYDGKEYIFAYNYSDKEKSVTVRAKTLLLKPKSFVSLNV